MSVAIVTTGGALWLMNGGIDTSSYAIAATSAAAIGSLVPDIDHPKAWISNRIPVTLSASGLTALGLYAYADWIASRGDTSLGGAMVAPMAVVIRPFLGLAWSVLLLGLLLLTASVVITRTVEHRGPTHSLAIGGALTLAACVGFGISPIAWTLGLWFGWGFLSHLLTDLITPMGCPSILWPRGLIGRSTAATQAVDPVATASAAMVGVAAPDAQAPIEPLGSAYVEQDASRSP